MAQLRTSKCNEECIISEKTTSFTMRRRKGTNFSNFQDPIMPFQNQLKFWTLCGFLSLQGSQQALAGSDISSQLQSMASLGDLGDISTGFASVREISLQLPNLKICVAISKRREYDSFLYPLLYPCLTFSLKRWLFSLWFSKWINDTPAIVRNLQLFLFKNSFSYLRTSSSNYDGEFYVHLAGVLADILFRAGG